MELDTIFLIIQLHQAEVADTAEFAENGIESHISNLTNAWPKEDSPAVEDMQITFSQTLRRSLFVTCYSLLEDDLNFLCEQLAEAWGLSLRVKDLHGQGINRAQTYLVKVIKIRYEPMSTFWELLSNLGKIRNVIVHRAGRVTADDKALRNFAKKYKGLDIVDDTIHLEKIFLSYTLAHLHGFWLLLLTAVRNAEELHNK